VPPAPWWRRQLPRAPVRRPRMPAEVGKRRHRVPLVVTALMPRVVVSSLRPSPEKISTTPWITWNAHKLIEP
jgi:hypothetical protein